MEKVYVAGYLQEKKWFPLSIEGESYPEEVKCREGILEKGKITVAKEAVCLAADSCFYAKSARTAKQKYIKMFEKVTKEADTGTPVQPLLVQKLHAVAYTDGSFNRALGRYGYGVLLKIGKAVYEYFGGDTDTTGGWQVNGELQGALFAIEKAIEAGCSSIEIRYDYEGVHKWADGLWRTNKGYTSEYQKKVQEYRKKIVVSFIHIKSHTGNKGNERADALARLGAGLIY